MGAALKFKATVVGAAIVDGEDHIALLSQEEEIEIASTQPGIGDQLAVRAAIYVNKGGIFLSGLHVGRGDKAIP